ncbi:hypothetical protein HZA97_08650 [Candidatus Woesearchaeota archaeon]|nr:hypothetical protein [Candidatus Woesearchaeota archaeon]
MGLPNIANVKFKKGVGALDLEKVISEYKLTKMFPDKESSSDLELSRLYVLDIRQGGTESLKELKEKYGNLLEYAELPPERRLIR